MRSTRAYLSACLCFKDAASYLPEWLAFYTVLGVEHFYLYNNESTDGYASALAPFLGRGVITLVDFPGRGVQAAMYAHCLKTFGPRTRWLLFCDDDEFFFPVHDRPLPDVLAGFESQAGLAAAWMLYGSSGHRERPPGLVIERFTRRHEHPNPHVKCIVDPARVIRPRTIGHEFECAAGFAVVDEQGRPMAGPLHPHPTADLVRVNHYLTKSIAEMTRRRTQVQADTGAVSSLPLAKWFELEAAWNSVDDPLAARYAGRVRQVLARGL